MMVVQITRNIREIDSFKCSIDDLWADCPIQGFCLKDLSTWAMLNRQLHVLGMSNLKCQSYAFILCLLQLLLCLCMICRLYANSEF